MFRRLGLVFAALALFSIAGGHWAVLQSVAWVEMLHEYSQHGSGIALAVERTFDGRHPCKLCRQIQVAKAGERKGAPTAPTTKDDAKVKALVADSVVGPLIRTAEETLFPRAVFASGPSRTDQPPTPPPRQSA